LGRPTDRLPVSGTGGRLDERAWLIETSWAAGGALLPTVIGIRRTSAVCMKALTTAAAADRRRCWLPLSSRLRVQSMCNRADAFIV